MASTYIELKSVTIPLVDYVERPVKTRVAWIDSARIIACFFALIVHTSAGAVMGIENTSSPYWWMGNLINSFARWALPVFVMVSGALLLNSARYEPIALFYKKRASRIIIPLIAWTVFYLLFTYFGKLFAYGEQTSLWVLGRSFLYGYPYYHLWYLYMIIGLYFFVPFLLKVTRQSSHTELMVLCAGLFVFSIIGNVYMTYFISYHIPSVFTFIYYLPYFLAGHIISRMEYEPPVWLLWTIFGVSGLLNSIGYYLSFSPERASDGYFCNCLNVTVIPMALSVMFLLKKVNLSFIKAPAVTRLAALSLGIYVIHPFFLNVLRFFGVTAESFYPLLSIPLIALFVFIVSLTASLVIGKIPWLKRTIGL